MLWSPKDKQGVWTDTHFKKIIYEEKLRFKFLHLKNKKK